MSNVIKYPNRRYEGKEEKTEIPLQLMDPIVYLYASLFYDEYLEIIYRIGRGQLLVADILDNFKNKKHISVIYKELNEMTDLKLIEKIEDSKYSYVKLKRYGVLYMTYKDNKDINPSSIREPKATSTLQLEKSMNLYKLFKEMPEKSYHSIKKIENKHNYLVGKLGKAFVKAFEFDENKINSIVESEIKKKELNHKTFEDLENLHTYFSKTKFQNGKIIIEFTTFDLTNNMSKPALFIRLRESIRLFQEVFFEPLEILEVDYKKYVEFNFKIWVSNSRGIQLFEENKKNIIENNFAPYEVEKLEEDTSYIMRWYGDFIKEINAENKARSLSD